MVMSQKALLGASNFSDAVLPEFLTKLNANTSFIITSLSKSYVVGPCHHGMARPQVADRGTASDKEGSCE